MSQPDENQLTRPWVDWTARQIHDPVWRLRYLQSVAPAPLKASRWKSRKTIGLLTLLALGLVAAPLSLRRLGAANAAPPVLPELPAASALPPIHLVEPAVSPSTDVWSVEKASDFEVYSNGLRIENQYAVRHRPRAYVAFSMAGAEGRGGEKRTDPAGIVYHTTESLQAPFESSQNNRLKQVGESLIDYVRRRRCYNFLIDRFGRVFRIVNESDAADHAGHSVWADDRYFYVNLNDSFIGISFEAQTGAGEAATSAGNAQVRAAGMLTEMLRSRYKIPGRNCVTHAQVSVNPANMQIGYHVDWASSFPFERLGLPDNYATPSPAISLFGFAFDASFEQRAGVRLAAGASAADRGLVERAEAAHLSLAAYRKALHRRYLKILASQRG
ncbi:MAG: peptidoglycan recognition family protein [Candidatus Solibacter sp.]|nr:peptidoglycan recognition family protein [Candidatus Solibacter sp.]